MESHSLWLPPNPRATGGDGKGLISMEDAPLLASLDVPVLFAALPQGFGAAELGFKGRKTWKGGRGEEREKEGGGVCEEGEARVN